MKLRALITQYVAFRQALGEQFESASSLLNTFCRQIGDEIDVKDINADQVNAFLAATGPVTNYWHRKHSVLRGLYHYAISRGVVAVSPLPMMVPKRPPRFVPYVYTQDEVQRLLKATTVYRPAPRKLQPHTGRFYCYCTGLGYASAKLLL